MADDVLIVRLDDPDVVSGVFIPGTGGASEADIAAAVEAHREDPDAHPGYATTAYVDEQVATGGDPEFVQDLIDVSVASHVGAAEPHPAYDDIPSLTLLFENGLV